jgi:YfiR/HmsC-like
VWVSLIALVASCVNLCAADKPSEYEVEAAYLFNFTKFVKWRPATNDARTSFPICVLGQDHLGEALDKTVSGEKIDGLPVTAVRVTTMEQAVTCRVVFVDESEQRRLASILPALSQAGVLTVSNMPGFADRGGIIQFHLVEGRVRFEVNLDAAESAGLTLSSDLLKVATRVRRRGMSS